MEFNPVWCHAGALILQPLSVRRELPRLRKVARMDAIVYLRFLINYVKSNQKPLEPLVVSRPNFCCIRKVVLLLLICVVNLKNHDFALKLNVIHAGDYPRRGSDIASMHSLRLYSSRSRILKVVRHVP